jgi:multidrug resistance efflux pump
LEQLLPGLSEWRDLSAERLRRGQELMAQDALTLTELNERRRVAMEADSRYQEAVAKRVMLEGRVKRLGQILGFERQRLGRFNEERTDLITELELKRREKEGQRDEIQLAISRLNLYATEDGIVTKLLRRPGELVASGEPVLLVMRDEQLWVEAYLKVAEKKYVRPGDPVEVVAPAYSGTLKGRVMTVRPKLEPLPGPPSALLGQQNYVVLVIALDDPAAARSALSPAQEVTTRVRRRLLGEDQAIADGVQSPQSP